MDKLNIRFIQPNHQYANHTISKIHVRGNRGRSRSSYKTCQKRGYLSVYEPIGISSGKVENQGKNFGILYQLQEFKLHEY